MIERSFEERMSSCINEKKIRETFFEVYDEFLKNVEKEYPESNFIIYPARKYFWDIWESMSTKEESRLINEYNRSDAPWRDYRDKMEWEKRKAEMREEFASLRRSW